jgi:predicted DNA repair protein MutK
VVALLATVGVYGLVALIVRMDDIGFNLIKRSNGKGLLATFGNILVKALPVIIKLLGFIGTIALLLVSGGIFAHNIEYLHHVLEQLPLVVKELLLGLAGGLIVLLVVKAVRMVLRSKELRRNMQQ